MNFQILKRQKSKKTIATRGFHDDYFHFLKLQKANYLKKH